MVIPAKALAEAEVTGFIAWQKTGTIVQPMLSAKIAEVVMPIAVVLRRHAQ